MQSPKVSIIFLCYNQERFVEEALRAALDQTYLDFEIIVADDCSTDKTVSVIEGVLAKHKRASVVRMASSPINLGIAQNWNRAAAISKGEILVCMAGDDISAHDRLEKTVAIFQAEPEAYAIVSQARIVDRDGRLLHKEFERNGRPSGLLRRNPEISGYTFWSQIPVIGATAAYRATVMQTFGPIENALSEDNPSLYRAMLMGGVYYCSEPTVSWRWHGANASLGASISDEDVHSSVVRRAARKRMEFETCKQYRADAAAALAAGLFGRQGYESEIRRIESLEALLSVGWRSSDPSQSLMVTCACVGRHLRTERFSLNALGYSIRSLVKAATPVKIKDLINRRSW